MSHTSVAHQLGFGVFHHAWAFGDTADAAVLDQVIASTELAERLGCFDIAWFTEQHDRTLGDFWGRVATPHLLMAHLAARTDRIGLGAGVRLLGDLDPARVAEEVVTLEHLAGPGRIHLGIGSGLRRSADAEVRDRRPSARQHTAHLTRCLRGEWPPAQRELAVAMNMPGLADRLYVASTDARTLDQAAHLGLGYFLGMFGGERHPSMAKGYRQRGGGGPIRAVRLVHVAGDDIQARRRIAPVARRMWAGFVPPSAGWRERKARLGRHPPTRVVLDQLGWIVGGPDTVAEEISSYAEDCDLDGIDVAFHAAGLSNAFADEAMRIFATEVVPQVRARSTARFISALSSLDSEPASTATGAQP